MPQRSPGGRVQSQVTEDWNVEEALAWGRALNAPLEAVAALHMTAEDPLQMLPDAYLEQLRALVGRVEDAQLIVTDKHLWTPL